MILFISPDDRAAHAEPLRQYFQIRKTVFHDQLGWDVDIDGDMEHDIYDRMPCHYLLSIDAEGTVMGGLRQMPMSGPTLTWARFSDMIGNPADLLAPGVWETTRFAVRSRPGAQRFTSGVNRVAAELSMASIEAGLRLGARRHVAVCDERVVQLTACFGVPYEILGRRADGDGDIVCVAWEVSDASARQLAWVREQRRAS